MKVAINPSYKVLKQWFEYLPSIFAKEEETIYRGRNTIKIIREQGYTLNVKAFKKPNFVNRFIYGNFRKSKARRSFEYAAILRKNSILTPCPVGYVEVRKGIFFLDSYYISIHEDVDGMMREFKWGILQGREQLLQEFAQFTAAMHEKKIMHLDYSPGNILYKKEKGKYIFYLVDLNRLYFGNVSMETGCGNFRKLWGNEEMLRYIATEYAKARGFDENQCVKITLHYHRKFWKKFSKKHKDKKPYISE